MSTDMGKITLARLAARLAELEQEHAALQRENAALRRCHAQMDEDLRALRAEREIGVVPALVTQDTTPDEARERTSRRRLLRTVLGAAAATAGAGALIEANTGTAAANTGDPVILGQTNLANAGTQVKWNGSTGFTGVILLGNDTGFGNSGAFFPAAAGGWAGGGAAGVVHGVYGYTQASPTVSLTPVAVVGLATQGTGVHGETQSASISSLGVEGVSPHGTGVSGTSANGTGVSGTGGASSPGIGVAGSGNTGVSATGASTGVLATATGPSGFGVSATGSIAVTASSSTSSGIGVQGMATGSGGRGVVGSTSGSSASPAVHGIASGGGDGVLGQSSNPNLPGNGVHAVAGGAAVTPGAMAAVFGEGGTLSGVKATSTGANPTINAISSGSGPGVSASSSTNGVVGSGNIGVVGSGGSVGCFGTSRSGYGGFFTGGAAPLHLAPAGTAGPPVTGAHQQGDLMVDNTGTLFICTAAGTPGVWVKVGSQ